MSGKDVLIATIAAVRTIDGIRDAPDWAPDDLNVDQSIRAYLSPGESVPFQHAGRNRSGPVVEHRDTVAIEWHTLEKRTDVALQLATEALDQMRTAIWAAFYEKRLGPVTEIRRLLATEFGGLDWGAAETFGFRLLVDLSHTEAIIGLRETTV